ncbi:NlpC/P60 family protein [Otariodibacter sp.]|uniref:NlpC/P60 family protein n=1 Tax=Otariodibacter sp. TaxID=3030919 RepID=UPI002619AE03|nr:NlpC/P60 family protein [Otariodibacter sp.]
MIINKIALLSIVSVLTLVGCSSTVDRQVSSHNVKRVNSYPLSQGNISDPIFVISGLSDQHQEWKGTRYVLGGTTKNGVDCSAFVQLTFRQLFGLNLPRMTKDQAKEGNKVSKSNLRPGDLVFFKTGRGPNGYHVGIYAQNGKFLHASTKGGVIYSDLNSPYWSKTYWQARRV